MNDQSATTPRGLQVADLRKESTDQAMKVLSDEQKERYRELLGKPFEMRRAGPG